MDHDRLRGLAFALRDGELTAREREEASSHLRDCSECRQALERWPRIAEAFLRVPAPPSRAQTEAFVERVMARLDPEAESVPGGWWGWLGSRWMIPALSAGLAALFFSIMGPAPDWAGPFDSLFLLGARDRSVARLVLPPDPSGADGLIGFLAEDR